MTKHLMELVKDAWENQFLHLKEKRFEKVENHWEKINNEIKDTNPQIKLLDETVTKPEADCTHLYSKYSFEAEKKTSLVEIEATSSMENTLKRAAFEKQELIDKFSAKKRCLTVKKADIQVYYHP